MDSLERFLEQATRPVLPQRKDYRIGIIGTGFIVEHCHLVAYQQAGFTPYGITSRDNTKCQRLADRFAIPNVFEQQAWLVVGAHPNLGAPFANR